MRSASAAPPSRSVPGSMTANSSPPQRPARSISRMLSASAVANSRSTSSPNGWPQRSLICLKSSRSVISSASGSSKRPGAGQLGLERALGETPVREPRERVDERLLLDGPVLANVRERDRRVADEPVGRLALILAEALADEDERAEALPPRRDREAQPLALGVDVAGRRGRSRRRSRGSRRRRPSPRPRSRRSRAAAPRGRAWRRAPRRSASSRRARACARRRARSAAPRAGRPSR